MAVHSLIRVRKHVPLHKLRPLRAEKRVVQGDKPVDSRDLCAFLLIFMLLAASNGVLSAKKRCKKQQFW